MAGYSNEAFDTGQRLILRRTVVLHIYLGRKSGSEQQGFRTLRLRPARDLSRLNSIKVMKVVIDYRPSRPMIAARVATGTKSSRGKPLLVKLNAVLGAGCITLLILLALMINGPTLSRLSTPVVTMAEFNGLKTGMTYEQAVAVIGARGEKISRTELAGIATVMYGWKSADGSNMNAMFQTNRLINKAQFGLQ